MITHHIDTCYDVQEFTHTLVKHFDLLMEHIKYGYEDEFISNICVNEDFFKIFGFRPDAIERLYHAIVWVYNAGTDRHFSHHTHPHRMGDHFYNEMTLFVRDDRTQKETKALFKFWVTNLFKDKGKDVWIYDLR